MRGFTVIVLDGKDSLIFQKSVTDLDISILWIDPKSLREEGIT